MGVAIIVFLLVIGFIFLLVEIFVTPGIILGLVGLLFMAAGVYRIYSVYGTSAGNYSLASLTLLCVGLILIALRSGVWDRIAQKNVLTGKVNVIDESVFHIGDRGEAVSALRPSGNALINGHKIEVTTEGESINSKEAIEIIKIRNRKIIVKSSGNNLD
jgi:membrane-bound serine protease (ClpP class)